jgi:hypothetical protein
MTIVGVVAMFIFLITLQSTDKDSLEARPMLRKWVWWSWPMIFFWWALYVFTPSKKDALLIVAGGQTLNFLTTDTSARRIPTELSNFLVSQIRVYAADANVELAGINVKAKLKEEAKKLSGEELLKRMHTDTTFAKAVLE